MKRQNVLTRSGALLLALLMVLSLCFTACEAEEVNLALDIADAVLKSALAEG